MRQHHELFMSRREYDLPQRPGRSRSLELNGRTGKIHLLEDGAPRYELRIDAEGRWFHEGVEIVHDDIRRLFYESLVRRENGDYYVEMANDEFPVIVEDAPLIVIRVTKSPDGDLMMLLSDGSATKLNPRALTFEARVPYCVVRDNIEARFSRPAYYQLAEFIEYDEKRRKYYIIADGKKVCLDVSDEPGAQGK